MRYAAVIAAAGLSANNHELKPMMCLGEEPVIDKIIRGFQTVGVEEVVVVTGYKSKILAQYFSDSGIRIVENSRYAETEMIDSLLLGLRQLRTDYDYVFITPADVPLVRPETLRAMQGKPGRILCPVCNGSSGHPLLLHSSCLPLLEQYDGADGLRGAVTATGIPVTYVPVEDPGILLDADTPEDFKLLRRTEKENRSNGRLWPDVHIHIAKGDTILTPEIAQLLDMIEHTNTIQDACSCMHMSYSKGWTLLKRIEKELGYPLVERFAGGPDGGTSRLTPRGRQLLTAYNAYQKQVRAFSHQLFGDLFPPELD